MLKEFQAVKSYTGSPTRKPLRAAVSGGSATGLTAALRLAKRGFRVDVYEKRTTYEKNVQWAARQGVIDILAKIDPGLSERFLNDVASDIPGGSLWLAENSTLYPGGECSRTRMPKPSRGNPDIQYTSAAEFLKTLSVCLLDARKFEEFLYKHVASKKAGSIRIHHQETPNLHYDGKTTSTTSKAKLRMT